MKIIQKNLTRLYEFDFGDDALSYRIKQWGRESSPLLFIKGLIAESEVSIPYEKIPMHNISKIKTPFRVFRTLAGLCFIFGAIAIIGLLTGVLYAKEIGLVLLLLGGIFVVLSVWVRSGYINYKQTDANNKIKIILTVMEDKQSEEIQQKIKENWLKKVRELYAFIDVTRTQQEERNKIQWLMDRGAISPSEFQNFLEQIKTSFAASPEFPSIAVKPSLN